MLEKVIMYELKRGKKKQNQKPTNPQFLVAQVSQPGKPHLSVPCASEQERGKRTSPLLSQQKKYPQHLTLIRNMMLILLL